MLGFKSEGSLDTRKLLWILLSLALLTRVIAVLVFADLSPNAAIWEYGRQAQCAWRTSSDLCLYFPNGNDHYPSAYMPPLLSYYWLSLFHLFGDGTLARALWLAASVAAGVGAVALTFHLSLKLIASVPIAFFAALALAVYPTFVFVSATYHQTNWAVFLLLAVVAIAVKLAEGANPWRWGAVGGALCGIAALNRSEMLIVGPILLALGAIWGRGWRRFTIAVATAAVATIAIMGPWWVRNYSHFDRFIPVAQSQGFNLWKGYNPYTNGSGNMSEHGAGALAIREVMSRTPQGRDYETRLQDAFSAEFRKDVENSSTGRLLRLGFNKVALLWAFDWTDRDVTGSIVYRLPWLVANLLALIGVFFAVRRRRSISKPAAVIYSVAVALLTVAYALTSVHSRYRMHIEPFLFILAAFGVVGLWTSVRAHFKQSQVSIGDADRQALEGLADSGVSTPDSAWPGHTR